ncbi:hypothetical protein A3L04_05560 [Thermococcus chitonophagus]|uniref:Uncharacterized protein n=1 Tax=Thermococcus chitonophagus TaxID=54262 RepID=A0A2Z2N4W5_9EURY|nr:hypothetical protein A3L04_05560 [Thermococcus chitonophagus]
MRTHSIKLSSKGSHDCQQVFYKLLFKRLLLVIKDYFDFNTVRVEVLFEVFEAKACEPVPVSYNDFRNFTTLNEAEDIPLLRATLLVHATIN